MLLPQSSAFGALKNRLNSVSAIGLLHSPPSMPTSARPSVVGGMSTSSLPGGSTGTLNSTVASRLRTRDTASAASDLKWPELLDKFKQTQDRARRRNERLLRGDVDPETPASATLENGGRTSRTSLRSTGAGDADFIRSGHKLQNSIGRSLAPGTGPVKTGSGLTVGAPGGAGGAGPNARFAASAEERPGPHKRGHSLAGLGKFASGIARAGGSRDRDKKK